MVLTLGLQSLQAFQGRALLVHEEKRAITMFEEFPQGRIWAHGTAAAHHASRGVADRGVQSTGGGRNAGRAEKDAVGLFGQHHRQIAGVRIELNQKRTGCVPPGQMQMRNPITVLIQGIDDMTGTERDADRGRIIELVE